ncbi:Receptor-type guanylate cyclase gcy [Seminavis robusta]|uniref:Phosphodiesterase n=1 Tax=Seminavis robusta TaxID=568900 RepID=A0A9N8E8E8_9STRA|nr:Receptor-type guanylate cyclase gcy [Seminavis robusta]|eukprot:Sro623_g177140.1 Receptor-type guanylate cyclase gcy (1197) ;mRNA; r:22908-27553
MPQQSLFRGSLASTSSQNNGGGLRGLRSRSALPLCTKWRILQWMMFLGLLIGVGFAIHAMQSQQEENNFEQAFQTTSDQILLDADQAIQRSAALLETLALSMATSARGDTSSSTENNRLSWPLVTVDHFDLLAQNYQQQSHAAVVAYAPIVRNPTEWQEFATQQLPPGITKYAFKVVDGVLVQDFSTFMTPLFQVFPGNATTTSSGFSMMNFNLYEIPWLQKLILSAAANQQAAVSHIIQDLDQDLPLLFPHLAQSAIYGNDTWSVWVQPIFEDNTHTNNNNNNKPEEEAGAVVVGYVLALVPWGPTLFGPQRTESEGSTLSVLQEGAPNHTTFTYHLDGTSISYLGPGDSWVETQAYGGGEIMSNKDDDNSRRRLRRRSLQQAVEEEPPQQSAPTKAPFQIHVYPTNDFHDSYSSSSPATFTAIVIALLALVALWFALCQYCHDKEVLRQIIAYEALNGVDWVRGQQQREKGLPENNKQLMRAFLADQEHQAPTDRGVLDASSGRWSETNTNPNNINDSSAADLDNLSNHSSHHPQENLEVSLLPAFRNSKPVADLFPSATVLFADIKGFTPWSSVRSPAEAFCLLESLYDTWDRLAQKRRVFRVETIGDCYTAVCGLPERRPDHAVALCHYARGCMRRFRELTRMLDTKLGPETSELALRVGINSGPIMAGILRGGAGSQSSKFQLFGDTVSLAQKIEHGGAGGRIHLSKETAAQLREAGKAHWVQEREDRMITKKGELVTYWLVDDLEEEQAAFSGVGVGLNVHANDMPEQTLGISDDETKAKMTRLIGWTYEIMFPLLKMIVARRTAEKERKVLTENPSGVAWLEREIGSTNNVLDEVEEVISLPHYDAKVQKKIKPDNVELDFQVEAQLEEYLTVIANLYHSNPFHNVSHAMHMTLSATKMLNRIVRPEAVIDRSSGKKKKQVDSELHDYTYGINSDPLTQFAVILAALIHDVDHRGVPNNVLCKEEQELAAVYDNKSVAEQNSVDIAWECLMDPRFKELRKCIYANEAELRRFRALLVNCVMSTDIFDKQLSALRKARWEKAFQVRDDQATPEEINRKATIVIEHLIQASDVSHCMQHWHVYQRWNERLFHEMYRSFRLGRSPKDPSEGWYKGEIWFFDNYVIPLAKKLNQCGVFGVSSDEYLTYAQSNRNEWEEKGQQLVDKMIKKYKAMLDEEEKKKVRRSRRSAKQA